MMTRHVLWQEAGLPLWLRPYEVLVTSNRTSLIELVPNAVSIHAIKAKSPANTSLRAHFIARYGLVSELCNYRPWFCGLRVPNASSQLHHGLHIVDGIVGSPCLPLLTFYEAGSSEVCAVASIILTTVKRAVETH